MVRIRQLVVPAAFLVMLAGCTAPVQFEYNAAPYGSWHTFSWQAPKVAKDTTLSNPIVDSGILATRVKNAVVATLTAHGYEYVTEREQADFVVTYHTAIRRDTGDEGATVVYGVGGWWNYPFSTVFVAGPSDEPPAAALIVDIINAENAKLVWRGWLTRSLRQSNFSQAAVNKAVTRIFSKFPPPPKL